ncbi:lipopolysaccharide biosynthesis protein RfbH [Helicobacter sp. 16-1353]|nr:lipopolysaccharide biosynthesis protein RfbH [Helicobacter sp. 16-1353]
MEKAEHLKLEILQKVKEYYELAHKPMQDKDFIAGDRINYAGRIYDEKEMVNLVDSSLDFWLTAHKYAAEFESKLAKYLGISFALLVNSGSSANLLAFATLTSPLLKDRAIKKGDEVITVSAGFPTTISPIIQFGAIPVFVDIDLDNANIDIENLESNLKSAISPKTKAIFIAHTLGNPFNLKAIKELCNKYNLWLIEDNCDALGAKYDGRFTGTFGDIGTSSFYPAHHITMGEGGAVYTNNPLLKKIALSIRDWGRDCWCEGGRDNTCGARFSQSFGRLPFGYDHKYVYSHFGYNLKATEMQASIGVAQLEKLESFVQKRQENHSLLLDSLKHLSGIFHLPQATKDSTPSWFGFLLILRDNVGFSRNQITEFLESKNIQTRNLFGGNMLLHPAFDSLIEGIDYRVCGELKQTNKIMNDGFWIGVYPGINKHKIAYIAQHIDEFVNKFGDKNLINKNINGGGNLDSRFYYIALDSKNLCSTLLESNVDSRFYNPRFRYFILDSTLDSALDSQLLDSPFLDLVA